MAWPSFQLPAALGGKANTEPKPADPATTKPKPCCVCKEEKAARDECMLFSTAKDPEKDCASTIQKYKSCMAGFGFELP